MALDNHMEAPGGPFVKDLFTPLHETLSSAESITSDLGFDSQFCSAHIEPLRRVVGQAFSESPAYGDLIEDLWKRFVSFVGAPESAGAFDLDGYADELYLLTLAKLVCANVLERQALVRDRGQLESILQGSFFKTRGLNNLVEYDYFGWLHQRPFLDAIVQVAEAMQGDLRAYDFRSIPTDDLFGHLMAQLAKRAQRLLLGQACTPRWLAHELVSKVVAGLPENEPPRLVDMCCGSGAIVVEAVLQSKTRIAGAIPDGERERRLQELALAITGFDIDPLAVILAKIGWVLAARDWMEPFGAFPITIPIYHADSLFAITPLSDGLDDEQTQTFHRLHIADAFLELPRFLVSPPFQGAFDALIDVGYELAMSGGGKRVRLTHVVVQTATRGALAHATQEPTVGQVRLARSFLKKFATIVDQLNRKGRNGIWAFILRNSYRPGLVAGQFNGLTSNPPWLALSRIANNPYWAVLRRKAEQYGIKPPGAAFLHIEMATIFLLHAVDRYLRAGARVGCIVPDTVRTGYNHDPFRTAAYAQAPRSIDFRVDEVWLVSETTFKNLGAVLIGSKEPPLSTPSPTFPGFRVAESGMTPLTIHRNVQGKRTAWSEQAPLAGKAGFFDPAPFRQGADIMPRTLFFHELAVAPMSQGQAQWQVQPIDRQTSSLAFAVRGAHKHRDFQLTTCVLPKSLFFDVLTSNLLTPFDLAAPLQALLPIRRGTTDAWKPLGETEVAALGTAAAGAFREIRTEIGAATLADIWARINKRQKLAEQRIQPGRYLVFTGTSGEVVCAAFAETASLGTERLIIDQTLNWARVETLDEALYLTGLFNSEAIDEVIRDFQPEGAFGRRHIHSLAFRATPPFDPNLALHQDVVARTRLLISEYVAAKAIDTELQEALKPNGGQLAQRRSVIRLKLRAFPAYADYVSVCRELYGL